MIDRIIWETFVRECLSGAKIGPSVIDELMGGCSLTCAFPWDAMAGDSASNGAFTHFAYSATIRESFVRTIDT
jgi:hypothetical protein